MASIVSAIMRVSYDILWRVLILALSCFLNYRHKYCLLINVITAQVDITAGIRVNFKYCPININGHTQHMLISACLCVSALRVRVTCFGILK